MTSGKGRLNIGYRKINIISFFFLVKMFKTLGIIFIIKLYGRGRVFTEILGI